MFFLQVFLFFVLLPNIVLLFLLKKDFCKSLGNRFSLLISYGIAPLMSGLLFYYLIQYLPRKTDIFYIILILLFWFGLFLYSKTKIKEVFVFYRQIIVLVKKTFSLKQYIAFSVLFLITVLFSIQTFAYPISDGDSAYYFAQTQALYQTRDADWSENGSIFLDGANKYNYNPMIRPGIPSFMALAFLFGQKGSNYSVFNFFFVYYYYLLLGMLLLLVSRIATQVGKNKMLSQFLALLFFIFYWNMTRFYIFNNKEVVIYFFALAGIYLMHNLIAKKERDIKTEVLLGVVLGCNAFINFHGTVIGMFLILILLIFSKLPFWQRIWQVATVFVAHLIFSAFEFWTTFGLYFLSIAKRLLHINTSTPQILSGDETTKAQHEQMYQAQNVISVFLKGKLQFLTSPGSYGFSFLLFLIILFKKFRAIINSLLGKIILVLMAIYYLVLIDPFNLNRNNLSVVLWGSPKYSMFLVLLAIIFVANYFDSIAKFVTKFILKYKISILIATLLLVVSFIIFRSGFLAVGLKALLGVIEANREISFYQGKIYILYYVALSFIILFGISLAIFAFSKFGRTIANKFYFILGLLIMIAPFFIVDVGKVPLQKTFSYLNQSEETRQKNIIYFGDEFKVFYYARQILPKKTPVKTYLMELYPYNDYFSLRGSGYLDAEYEISGKCSPGDLEMFRSGAYTLCHISTPTQK